ncbi:alpha-ketoglutarate-dependent dioxygenase AlkB [Sphingosinicella sp.]|uniref:alpha-ketoglutarate-dependent dioxygenase AlkB family protein n=1 Tax=Sphingosinicella sp. TaxID=1917971 RepID=UPI0035B41F2C
MRDLFSIPKKLERIPLQNAEVYYQPDFDLGFPPDLLLRRLIDETPWRQENINVWGRTHQQPRLVAWYGDAGKSYSYSGIKLDPLPWTEILLNIRDKIERATDLNFNSVLLNFYRDNNDSMGLHSDDEKELGSKPSIASVSLGASRPLTFKSKIDFRKKPVKIILRSGSLLLMKGDTQHNYKHGIAKERQALGPRVNLTFRTIFS